MKLLQALIEDREGIAWPSQETIASAIGVERETVCKAIKRLRERGSLTLDCEDYIELLERRSAVVGALVMWRAAVYALT